MSTTQRNKQRQGKKSGGGGASVSGKQPVAGGTTASTRQPGGASVANSVKQPVAGSAATNVKTVSEVSTSKKPAVAGGVSTSARKPATGNTSAGAKRRQRKRASSSRKGLLLGAIASLIIAIVVAFVVIRMTLPTGDDGSIPGVVTYTGLSRQHVSGTVKYAQNPPVGGDHNSEWQTCGIYSTPLINEHAVHSMEHGAVWITYQPSLAEQDIQQLRSLVRGHHYALLSPYPGLPSPVVISAWGLQLKVDSANDPHLAQFLNKYEQGPQTPEPGASCSGGFGTPDVQ